MTETTQTTPSDRSVDLGAIAHHEGERPAPEVGEIVFDIKDLKVHYGQVLAVSNVDLAIERHQITAFIGPSGCGKTTVLRCLNRMNDLIEGARVDGRVSYHGVDLYDRKVSEVEVRRRIGMVFQKPNPFPKSIFANVAYGPRLAGVRGKKPLADLVEQSLQRAALWDEVKDRLNDTATGLSGGQQQRLCIARALACEPEVILMDEPCSALDPIATGRIEDLLADLREEYTIVIVTHNMQQAARISNKCAFFTTQVPEDGSRPHGVLVEYDTTDVMFATPTDQRTENYVTGRFG